ncbi:MAG: hypothetical protein AAGC43_04560 [Bacteroidota bacterium]
MTTEIKEVKLLQKVFTKGDKIYKQVDSKETAYIYQVEDKETNQSYFEVFTRKTQQAYDFEAKEPLDHLVERYPHNEAFGYWAWTYSRGEDVGKAYILANNKFNKL